MKENIRNQAIGELLTREKYKFLPNGLLAEICREFIVLYDEYDEENIRSCDECHIRMTEEEYETNKGLCDVCIKNIN